MIQNTVSKKIAKVINSMILILYQQNQPTAQHVALGPFGPCAFVTLGRMSDPAALSALLCDRTLQATTQSAEGRACSGGARMPDHGRRSRRFPGAADSERVDSRDGK